MFKRRKFDTHIKSLVHFDYPYYAENYDGCRDEISGTIWQRHGSVKFCGTAMPCEEIVSGTPKFGYRCLHTQSSDDYIYAPDSGQFSLKESGSYEFDCWIRIAGSSTGNIVSFMSGNSEMLALKLNTENKLELTSSFLNLTLISTSSLSLNEWHHVRVRISPGQKEILSDGTVTASRSNTGAAAPSADDEIADDDVSSGTDAVNVSITEVRIGGFSGFTDEFIFRDALTLLDKPSSPYQGELNVNSAGGFIKSNHSLGMNSNQVLNTYASVLSASGTSITIGNIYRGDFSELKAGSEAMLHVTVPKTSDYSDLGAYAFRRILCVNGNEVILDRDVTEEFSLSACVSRYEVQLIVTAEFRSFTLNAGWHVLPAMYESGRGGIIVIKTQEDMNLHGILYACGTGPDRRDDIQMTHSELIDRFIIGSGGGIYLVCGGTLTVSGGIGAPESHYPCGFGGLPNHSYETPSTIRYVGYGRNASDIYGSGCPYQGGRPGRRGQGILRNPLAGTNAVIIAKRCSFSSAVLWTGGQDAETAISQCGGGGGTGFCYIACEEAV